MVRYASRPWYSPLGFMASHPHSYAPLMVATCVLLAFPMRYRLSEYFERQRDGYHVDIRRKAIAYYNEMERMHRRQALVNLEPMQDDNSAHRKTAEMYYENMHTGSRESEMNYWYAHQRDAMRAEKLLLEIQELKKKIGEEAK